MGNFFTSSQIYNNENLDKQQFIDKFTNAMADNGYTVCDSDESEMSYILRFADNSKWVAVTSESYEEGGQTAQADAGRIAKMLGTYCMNTEVIDSDCASMFLYDKDGKESDMLLMGRYDDYFGDNINEPKEKIWTRFLSDGCTWNKFTEILGGEYVFVEEGLAKLAPVIGMDSDNLLFSAEDDVDDEFVVFLDFRKTSNKNDKKFSLNNAFKQFIGTELEKKGFLKIKSRYPYYVRMVNNEILHIITYAEEKSIYKKFKSFKIFGGIATIYRAKLDFSASPKMNSNWLSNIFNVHRKLLFTDEMYPYKNKDFEPCFTCSIEPDKAEKDLKNIFDYIDNVLIYAMNKITDIDSFLKNYDLFSISMWIYEDEDFGKNYSAYAENEGLLYIKNDARQAIKDSYFKELECIRKQIAAGSYPDISSYEEFQKNLEDGYNAKLSAFDKIRNSEKLYSKATAEIEKRKKENIEILKESGLYEQPANEKTEQKKLTLKSAFTQVFGEALEPLGFKKVKNKYPYYVRVVNDEIVHVIEIQIDNTSGSFSILGGIATIYRKELDFSKDPKLEAGHWLKHLGWYYRNVFPSDYSRINEIAMNSFRLPDIDDSEDVKKCLCEALEKTMTWLIPELDKVIDADAAIMFLFRFSPKCLKLFNETDKFYDNIYYNESYLFIKAQNTDLLIDEYRKKLIFSNEFEKKYFGTESDILPESITNNIKLKLHSFLASDKTNLNAQRNALHNLQILKEQLQLISDSDKQPAKEQIKSTPQKLTLKSAFTQVFGEALEPLGFVKLKKTKEPCYVRIVDDGIIDVITYRTLSAYKTGYKNVEMRVGILSLYNPELIFPDNPTFSLYCIHTLYNSDYYRELDIKPRNETIDNVIDFECELWNINKNIFSDPEVRKSEFDNRIGNCLCSTSDTATLLRALNNTCDVIKDAVLPIMEKIKDNKEYIEYCYSLRRDLKLSTDINAFREITRKDGNGLLLIKENYTADTSKYTERDLAMYVDDIEHGRYGLGDAANIEDFKKKFRDNCKQQKEICEAILNTPNLKQVFLEELESYKEKNIALLQEYGLIR